MTVEKFDHEILDDGTLVVTVEALIPKNVTYYLRYSVFQYLACEASLMGMPGAVEIKSIDEVEMLSAIANNYLEHENDDPNAYVTYTVATEGHGVFDVDLYIHGNALKARRAS